MTTKGAGHYRVSRPCLSATLQEPTRDVEDPQVTFTLTTSSTLTPFGDTRLQSHEVMSHASYPTAGPSDDTPLKEVAPFLKSLRRMLDTENPRILRWTPDGRAFEIHDMAAMTSYVLPKYFKHCKYTSFQRQLNYFHFRKWTKSRAVVCTFSTPFFQRDYPALTWRITRKRALSLAKSSHKLQEATLALSPPDVNFHKRIDPMLTVEVALPSKNHRLDDKAPLAWIDVLYPELDLHLLELNDPNEMDCCFSASTLLSL